MRLTYELRLATVHQLHIVPGYTTYRFYPVTTEKIIGRLRRCGYCELVHPVGTLRERPASTAAELDSLVTLQDVVSAPLWATFTLANMQYAESPRITRLQSLGTRMPFRVTPGAAAGA